MMRTVKLSKQAERKLNTLLEYLEKEWSAKVKQDFILNLDACFEAIKTYPESFMRSDFVKGLHQCSVTKQNTIYYTFDDSSIFVITLFDTRQNPKKLKKEITKRNLEL